MNNESNIPQKLYYSETHEWYETIKDEKGYGYIGITDHQQIELGDIIEVILDYQVGDTVEQGEVFGTIIGTNDEKELFMSISGKIIDINCDLEDTPENINYEPYDEGWIIKIKAVDEKEVDYLVNSEEYSAYLYGI